MSVLQIIKTNWPPIRLGAAFLTANMIALTAFLMLNQLYAPALGGLWFLAVLPMTLTALIAIMVDPHGQRSNRFYNGLAPALIATAFGGALIFLHEGAICVIMVAPIWLLFGWLGAVIARKTLRARRGDSVNNTFHSSVLILPFVLGLAESRLPPVNEPVEVTRSILVAADPQEIWPYALSNAHIDPHEGRWTISQNLIGLPRPRATVMHGAGVGALRAAYWGDHIRFDENITAWVPGRILAWRFSFPDTTMADFTDRHLSPDGTYMKIDSGFYRITPVRPGLTRLTLTTHYFAKTHVKPYAKLWGELFLGDVQDNILTVVRDRAQHAHERHDAWPAGSKTS